MKIYLDKQLNANNLISWFDNEKTKEKEEIAKNPSKKADNNLQIVLKDGATFKNISLELKKALKHMLSYTDIEKLSITDAKLTAENLKEIKEEIINEKTLKALSFSNNDLGDNGMDVIAEILKSNANIINCDLSNNKISDSGSKILKNKLKDNKNVVTIDLGMNEITEVGIKELNVQPSTAQGLHSLPMISSTYDILNNTLLGAALGNAGGKKVGNGPLEILYGPIGSAIGGSVGLSTGVIGELTKLNLPFADVVKVLRNVPGFDDPRNIENALGSHIIDVADGNKLIPFSALQGLLHGAPQSVISKVSHSLEALPVVGEGVGGATLGAALAKKVGDNSGISFVSTFVQGIGGAVGGLGGLVEGITNPVKAINKTTGLASNILNTVTGSAGENPVNTATDIVAESTEGVDHGNTLGEEGLTN